MSLGGRFLGLMAGGGRAIVDFSARILALERSSTVVRSNGVQSVEVMLAASGGMLGLTDGPSSVVQDALQSDPGGGRRWHRAGRWEPSGARGARTGGRNGSRIRTVSTPTRDVEARIPEPARESFFPDLLESRRGVDRPFCGRHIVCDRRSDPEHLKASSRHSGAILGCRGRSCCGSART